uniref:Uncharacterized protein n=1 Tax=Anopheles atroparvus TaxID=41427 RepID=A0AAG5CTN8_ANOAO
MDRQILAHPAHRIGVELIRLVDVVFFLVQIWLAAQETHRHILVYMAVERGRVARHEEKDFCRIVKLIAVFLGV